MMSDYKRAYMVGKDFGCLSEHMGCFMSEEEV